jgi:predicted O-methyltransferase YrrM
MRTIFAVQDLYVRPYISLALSVLVSSKDDAAASVAEAIRDTFYRTPSEREQNHIDAIERHRTVLEASREELEILDFGAHATTPDGVVVRRTLGEVTVTSSKPKRWALLLFYLIQRLVPERCLEFGTCVGISTLYQSASLSLNRGGSIVTMEGAPSLSTVAQKGFTDFNYGNITALVGRFSDLLPSVIAEHQPFELVFIDGHHERNATIEYFEKILPSVSRNAVVIFDDIHWSKGMKEAWKTIVRHRRVKYSVDLYQLGIVIVS